MKNLEITIDALNIPQNHRKSISKGDGEPPRSDGMSCGFYYFHFLIQASYYCAIIPFKLVPRHTKDTQHNDRCYELSHINLPGQVR